MDVDGTWRTTNCDTKLQGAVCGVSRGKCQPLGPRLAAHVQVALRGCSGHILNPALQQGPLPEGYTTAGAALRAWPTPPGFHSGSIAILSTWRCCWATRRRCSAARKVGESRLAQIRDSDVLKKNFTSAYRHSSSPSLFNTQTIL